VRTKGRASGAGRASWLLSRRHVVGLCDQTNWYQPDIKVYSRPSPSHPRVKCSVVSPLPRLRRLPSSTEADRR
jgi:hypothetical protein